MSQWIDTRDRLPEIPNEEIEKIGNVTINISEIEPTLYCVLQGCGFKEQRVGKYLGPNTIFNEKDYAVFRIDRWDEDFPPRCKDWDRFEMVITHWMYAIPMPPDECEVIK